MRIEGYSVERELGKGGMATVYLAIQESFDREVALKVMAPALVADSTFAERFLREARIVAHLSHPHIVSVFDVGVCDDSYYLAMEYHTGGELTSRIATGLAPDESIEIVKQIASALDYAHANGYVHRDIKPGNVLFSQHGHAVLTDFGIAKAADASTELTQVKKVVGDAGPMTREGAIVGTPSYMSPEQARGQSVDGRADLYSLGIVFFEMLCGRVPYEASDPIAVAVMHVNEPVPVLPAPLARFQPFLSRLLAKDPSDRPQTGAEVIAALEEIQRSPVEATLLDDQRTMIVGQDALPGATAGRGSRALLWSGVSAGALLVMAVAGFALWPGSEVRIDAPTPPEVTRPRNGATPVVGDRSPEVARLLEEGEAALADDRLSTPPGNNAYEKFKAVLDSDPGNRRAREGIERVADRYLELSRSAIGKQSFRRARGYLDKVGELAPAHPELAASQRLLAGEEERTPRGPTREEALRNELRIKGLLGSARRALEKNQLTTPPGDNAFEKYRAVLALDPSNKDALEGVEIIAGRYIALAARSIERGELDQADEYIAKAAEVAPRHPHLGATRESARVARRDATAG